ncbi:RNA-directed DNA polymerase [Marinibaculum pumilum]|uniref:RNA-directed DNA polymerase n=1 Tax=Marinibaculum pumilum TaxID=1766165 RepID=A0ABV7L204_9PROT
MIDVNQDHFRRAALEIGKSGENDTLPYDIDAGFIRDKAENLSEICFQLFQDIDSRTPENAARFVNGLTIGSERLLVPAGSHGFRITTKINPFWNLYLNGLGFAIAEANEGNRSDRVHSYRLSANGDDLFDRTRSWRTYKEATLEEPVLNNENSVVVQTDISSFYEHVYHHRLENVVNDLAPANSTIATQIDRILSKLSSGRSFGLPVGGQCARVLAEVLMTPIDASLSDAGIVWHRFVDDFTLVCNSQQDAYAALSILSNTLADYGLSLNRTKTTTLSAKHYREYIAVQLGQGDETTVALRELDLHFDPYSDAAQAQYEKLKESFDAIDIQFLLDLEKEKSQPDAFVMAQIGRALKFQEPQIAAQLCATLLDPSNLDSFRASWSKILRGVYAVRANEDFEAVFDQIDDLLDRIPATAPHLLMPEANTLHFLRAIRFRRTEARGRFVRQTYDQSSSSCVKRACVDCWRRWRDRASFMRLRNQWQNLSSDEQRMFWLAAGEFGDDGAHARNQLRATLAGSWRLGFEANDAPHFARAYQDWVQENG